MFSNFLKSLSILKKFLFINLVIFLFQNLDRVILFDNQFNLVGDTDTLDLDPRSFSSRLDIVELEILDEEKSKKIVETKNINKEKTVSFKDVLTNYSWSKDYGKPFTFIQEGYDQFLLTTVKNITLNGVNIGYLAISENANDVKSAIDERKTFILRTAIFIIIVIFIFSFVLNRYFLKPIKNLVAYTKIIKEKSKKKKNINKLKKRKKKKKKKKKKINNIKNKNKKK